MRNSNQTEHNGSNILVKDELSFDVSLTNIKKEYYKYYEEAL